MISDKLIRILSTFFGVGYLPFFPGTWAALLALIIYLTLRGYLFFFLLFSFIVVIIGFLVAEGAEKVFQKKDCKFIVIDELSAALFLYICIPYSSNFFLLIIAFVLFRIFDIIKPFPIKRIEKLKGSYGIMLDDLAAAVYSFIGCWIIFYLRGRQ